MIDGFSFLAGPSRVGLIDSDLDGDLDIIISGSLLGAEFGLYENLGGSTFSTRRPVGGPGLSVGDFVVGDIDGDSDQDLFSTEAGFGRAVVYRCDLVDTIGESYCGPGVLNSTGLPSRAFATGSPFITDNLVNLRVGDLPPNVFGIFATSQTQGFVTSIPNSMGTLCLGGTIGRFVGPGQILGSGPSGTFDLPLDLSSLPQGLGTVAAMAGESWNFQAWHRDVVGGTVTSNFSDGVSIHWQ